MRKAWWASVGCTSGYKENSGAAKNTDTPADNQELSVIRQSNGSKIK
jgi:hypothetical protein